MTKIKNTEKLGKKLDMQKLLAPAALVILYVLFSIVGNNFFTWDTLTNILQSAYYIGFMAFGVTFVIITGGIDLSLGTVMMCSALLGAYAFNVWKLPLIVGVLLTLFVAIAFGLLNGVLIAKVGLPPFIATLGTQMISMGIGSIITKVQAQTWPPASAEVGGWFKQWFVRSKVLGIIPIGAVWLFLFTRPRWAVTSTPSAPMRKLPACPVSTPPTGESLPMFCVASSLVWQLCSTQLSTPPSPPAPALARKCTASPVLSWAVLPWPAAPAPWSAP